VTLRGALILSLISVGVSGTPARSVDCVVYSSMDTRFADAAAVFEGRVVSVEWIPGRECCHVLSGHVTLETDRWWKGEPVKRLKIGAVGQIFDLGESYVVFAFGNPPAADGCNGLQPLRESTHVVQWLARKQVRRATPLSSVVGRQARPELPPFGQIAGDLQLDPRPALENKGGQNLLALIDLEDPLIGLETRSSDWRHDSGAVMRVTEVLTGKPQTMSSRPMWSEFTPPFLRRVIATIDRTRSMSIDIAGSHVCIEDKRGRFWFFRTVQADGWRPRLPLGV
jgi:hypothetical protein